MGSGRGTTGRRRRQSMIIAVAIAISISVTCFHVMVKRSGAAAVSFAAADEGAARRSESGAQEKEEFFASAKGSQGEGPSSQAAWDPQGCQTIVFFHVPKTGGESINDLWLSGAGHERLPGWEDSYTMESFRVTRQHAAEQEAVLRNIKPWTREKPLQRHKVIEFHCGDALSFMQAREVLGVMRAEHATNDCGFFAFTVIKPPLDWIVSLYDDICHRRLRGHKDTCPHKANMTPKEEMLKYPHRDGMVSYLTHGFRGWGSPGPVDEATVEAVFASLRTHLDLVGFTNEVPRIRKYLTKRFAAPGGVLTPKTEAALDRGALHNANNAKTIRLGDFGPAELEQLNSTVQLDWKLYEAVLGDTNRRRFDLGPA